MDDKTFYLSYVTVEPSLDFYGREFFSEYGLVTFSRFGVIYIWQVTTFTGKDENKNNNNNTVEKCFINFLFQNEELANYEVIAILKLTKICYVRRATSSANRWQD